MLDACVCYLPAGPCHCRVCHTTFSDRGEAVAHLTDDQCLVTPCKTCGTAWWLSHSPGAPVPLGGSWCVCVGCGDTAIFTGRGLEVRQPNLDENDRIGQDQFILEYREQRELVRRTG